MALTKRDVREAGQKGLMAFGLLLAIGFTASVLGDVDAATAFTVAMFGGIAVAVYSEIRRDKSNVEAELDAARRRIGELRSELSVKPPRDRLSDGTTSEPRP